MALEGTFEMEFIGSWEQGLCSLPHTTFACSFLCTETFFKRYPPLFNRPSLPSTISMSLTRCLMHTLRSFPA